MYEDIDPGQESVNQVKLFVQRLDDEISHRDTTSIIKDINPGLESSSQPKLFEQQLAEIQKKMDLIKTIQEMSKTLSNLPSISKDL